MAVPTWAVGQVLSASDVNEWFVPRVVIKPTDQNVTSSTTLVNDNALVLPLDSNASYFFFCYLLFEGGTSGSSDLKWSFTLPGTATLRYHAIFNSGSGVVTVGVSFTGASTNNASTNGSGSLRGLTMDGTIVSGATAGNIQLQWAQNTSSGTSTTVHAQSCIWIQRIA